MGCIKEADSSDYFATSQSNPPAAQSNQNTTGDPVNVVTGAFTLSEQDLAFPNQRLQLEFTRHYNNQLHDADPKQDNCPLGPGWTHSLNLRLETGPLQDQKTYVDDHGSHIVFDLAKDFHNYIAPPGSLGLSLSRRQDGSFELRQIDGVTAHFNERGQILELRRPGPEADSRLTFQHDVEDRLVSVTGAGDRAIYFHYDDHSPLIQAITDHTGRRWAYRYNEEGELTEVHDPAARIRRYLYRTKQVRVTDTENGKHEGTTPQIKLLTIRAMEKVFRYFMEGDSYPVAEVTNQYTSDRRVYRQRDAAGGETLFDYNRFTRTTCVTDPAGWTTVYCYDEAGNTTKVRRPGGGITEFIFDDCRNLLAEIGPDGSRTEYVDFKSSERLECEQEFGRRVISNRSSYVTLTSEEIETGYDQFGNRPLRRDALGNTTRYYDYTQFGQPQKVELPDGSILFVEYDHRSGLPLRARQESAVGAAQSRSWTREWNYDPWGNITRFAEFTETPNAHTTSKRIVTTEYDEHGHHPISKRTWIESDAERDAFPAEEAYEWDNLGRLVALTTLRRKTANGEAQSLTTRFAYDVLGRQILLLDPKSTAICWELDLEGRTLEQFTVQNTAWKPNKAVPAESRLRRTLWSYDQLGRKTSLIQDSGGATSWEWDSRGFCTRIVEPSGRVTFYEYDRDGNEIARRVDTGYEVRIKYDLSGRPVSEENSLGNVISRKYDTLGRLVEITEAGSPQPSVTRYTYDSLGRDIRVDYADESYERVIYDDRGSLTRRERGRGDLQPRCVEEFDYDGFGRLTGVKSGQQGSPSQRFSIKRFDGRREDRLCDSLGHLTSTFYDSEDNPIKKIDAEGRALYFEYDELGRLRRRWSDDGSVESLYEYSANNQLVSAKEGSIHYHWHYDNHGRVVRHEQSIGARTGELVCQYDEAGRLTSKKIGKSWWTRYSYQPDSAYISRIEIPNASVELTRDVVGRVIEERWDTGGYTRYQYQPNGALVMLESVDDQGAPLFSQHLERDGLRRPILETRVLSGLKAVYKYDYDGLDRLNTVTLLDEDSSTEVFRYEYDDHANRLREFRSGEPYANYRYDQANRLLERTDPAGIQIYDYDDCGNLIQKGNLKFSYDAAQRLRTVSQDSSSKSLIEFTYAATDERPLITRDKVTESILYDGVQEAISESSDGRCRRAFWGAQLDTLIAVAFANEEPQRAHTDSMGSVICIGSAAAERNDYDPFGAPLNISGNPPLSMGYCGKRYEHETGFYYNRARFYDPIAGRFTQPDPKGLIDGTNLYLYARSNPTSYSDHTGFKSTKTSQGRISNAYDRLMSREPSLRSLKGLKMVHYNPAGHKTGTTYFKDRTFWNPVPHLEHFNLSGEKTSETYFKEQTFWNLGPHLEHFNLSGEKTSETYFKEQTFWNLGPHLEHFNLSGEKTSETYFKQQTFWNPLPHFAHYDLGGNKTGTSYIKDLSWYDWRGR